jgi:hypothetical protein
MLEEKGKWEGKCERRGIERRRNGMYSRKKSG